MPELDIHSIKNFESDAQSGCQAAVRLIKSGGVERLISPRPGSRSSSTAVLLETGGGMVSAEVHRHPRARRYRLMVRPDGSVRLTVPRGGSMPEALAFAKRQGDWLQATLTRLSTRPLSNRVWRTGTVILFRGEPVELQTISENGRWQVRFADQEWPVSSLPDDLRPCVEEHLRKLATAEFPSRVQTLAAAHGLRISRVTVRNQRTRWGSCSRRAVISLNWRLIQAPAAVQDYLFIHELMHLREMNHSPRYWALVAAACPQFREAEHWLKTTGRTLR